ncbi:hypothetical protein PMAYCL1PPCAC_04821, partial [Pristionchus mayeri]
KDKRYFHYLCFAAHVTKAASYVAFVSLFSLFVESMTMIAVKQVSVLVSLGIIKFVDFACSVALIYAILDEVRYFVLPYLIYQSFHLMLIVREVFKTNSDWMYKPVLEIMRAGEFSNGDSEIYGHLQLLHIPQEESRLES